MNIKKSSSVICRAARARAHQDTRIFLDFGMSFSQSGKYFSEFHQPRKCNCIEDFLFTGLLPELEGAYRTDYLEYLDRPREERGVDAVLLSHAHMDHTARART